MSRPQSGAGGRSGGKPRSYGGGTWGYWTGAERKKEPRPLLEPRPVIYASTRVLLGHGQTTRP
jgi:hypothetical protein